MGKIQDLWVPVYMNWRVFSFGLQSKPNWNPCHLIRWMCSDYNSVSWCASRVWAWPCLVVWTSRRQKSSAILCVLGISWSKRVSAIHKCWSNTSENIQSILVTEKCGQIAKIGDREITFIAKGKEQSTKNSLLNWTNFNGSTSFQVLNENASDRAYCHTCHTFLGDSKKEAIHNHKNHAIQSGLTNAQIECPTTFLRSLSNDKREAQYFFSNASLNCFVRIFQCLQIK